MEDGWPLELRKRQGPRTELWVMVFGFLALLLALGLPATGALVLLQDPSYRFWTDETFPRQVLAVTIGVMSLLAATCLVLAVRMPREALSVRLLVHVAAIFAGLAGALLVFVALPASAKLYTISGSLASQGCKSNIPEMVQLMDYSLVLYNLRMTPACSSGRSVEMCRGWAENEYTKYLRYLEEELDCGPLCPEEPMPQLRPQGGAAKSSLVAMPRGARSARRSLATGRHTGAVLEPGKGFRSSGLHIGDIVQISRNKTLVREAFKSLNRYSWNSSMAGMLGKDFRVLDLWHQGLAGLPSPDGSQNGVWYFPVEVLAAVAPGPPGASAQILHAAAFRLFSHGTTSMTCMPVISTRLRVLAWSFGDILFWLGLALLLTSLVAGCAGLACGSALAPTTAGFRGKVA